MPYFGSPAASAAVGLSPTATVTATKAAGNPTFNFNAIVESVLKVGSTYYCVYLNGAEDIRLATASSREGPWADAGSIWGLSHVSWKGARTQISAPFIMLNPDDGKYDLFYDVSNSDGTNRAIGFASATTINGTYTDHGSAILTGGSAGAWDQEGVAEPSVTYDGTYFYMAYMGEGNTPVSQYEKVGIAYISRAAGIGGSWSKAAGNPLAWGSGGSWNAALQSDPHIFFENGYCWIWTLGHSTISPTVSLGKEGLWYNAGDPWTISDWHEHPSNPILVPTAATWDSARCFRGSIYKESGIIGGVYSGATSLSSLGNYKGGNFTLSIT